MDMSYEKHKKRWGERGEERRRMRKSL